MARVTTRSGVEHGEAVSLSLVGRGEPRSKIVEMQRSRVLAATAAEVDERGYADTTVAHITRRARVSRRTFYELFDDREACLAAVFCDVVALVEQELAAAALGRRPWRERIRHGLALILAFFDREPVLARVCVVQTLQGGSALLERRGDVLERLVGVVDGGRSEASSTAGCSRLTAEGVVGAVLTIVHGWLARREHKALLDLTSELTGMIVLPYLGAAAARQERQRSAPASTAVAVERLTSSRAEDPLDGVQMRLTYRTVRILEGAHDRPGANNRQLGEMAEIQDQGQTSKLLGRLERLGLLANGSEGHAKGEPNAWSLTVKGEQVVQRIGVQRATSGSVRS